VPPPPVLLHADLDAFYASVEQRDHPELRGRPVIVGGTGRRGVVSAASYEARRFGVHSAMPSFEARRRCPEGVFLRGDMRKYGAVSRQVFAIFERFSPRIEAVSLDEAFLDLTGSVRLLGPPRTAGEALRRAVRSELGLAVSVGIAPTRMAAKIASEEAKPDGLLEVTPASLRAFLDPLPVGRLWGVGPVTGAALLGAGFATIGDLARAAPETLVRLLGEGLGVQLARLARGEDPGTVDPERAAVSYSEENTFEEDVSDRERLAAVLLDHAESVARRLRRDRLRARVVMVKVKLGEPGPIDPPGLRATGTRGPRPGPYRHPVVTRRATLAEPTDDGAQLAREARRLLERVPRRPIRLLGVAATGLEPAGGGQLGLFEAASAAARRVARLNQALDEITDRFGSRAVVRAGQEQAVRAGLSLQRKRGEADGDESGAAQDAAEGGADQAPTGPFTKR
jgi:DNA polymerase-4